MKSKLFAAMLIMLSFASCTQRVMCPTYSIEDQHELRTKGENTKSM